MLQLLFSIDPTLFSSAAGLESVLGGFIKLLLVIAAGLYVFFAFIVTRQVHIMRHTLIIPMSGFIQILGYVHLLMAIAVLVYFVVSL